MSANVNIRRARPGDVDTIVDIWMEMMREHERFEKNVQLAPTASQAYQQYASFHVLQKDSVVIVAEKDQEVIGFCLAYKTKNLPMFKPEFYGYLSDIAVRPGMQRSGIGKVILTRIIDWFRANGVKNIQLQVYEQNKPGKKFWEENEFRRYVRGLWLDL